MTGGRVPAMSASSARVSGDPYSATIAYPPANAMSARTPATATIPTRLSRSDFPNTLPRPAYLPCDGMRGTADGTWGRRWRRWASADMAVDLHGLPAAMGEDGPVDERVEPGGRLVEHEQVGPMLERDHQADLLLVALGVL